MTSWRIFEGIGVCFGNGINAYTDVDETVYRLSDVPTTREDILDTALLVLYDWSCGVLLQDDEIEKEILRNEYEENLLDNYSWMYFMNDYYNNDMNFIRDYVNVLNSITSEDIRQMLKSVYEQRNCIEAVLMPARW